jgi:hypothetical protein
MAVSNWSIQLSYSAWRDRISAIACSTAENQSSSMADKYEPDKCGVSGGEEGASDQERVDPSEPEVGAENQTMAWVPGRLGPLGDPFLL